MRPKRKNISKVAKPNSQKNCFVIQKHQASHLHYDLRLEVAGKLISWVLPKLPIIRAGEKHLAIQVESHPLAYKNFEGEIPKGDYGAGKIKIWDSGKFIPILPANGAGKAKIKNTEQKILDEIQAGKFSFIVLGEKMRGTYTLVRINEENKTWIIIRRGASDPKEK